MRALKFIYELFPLWGCVGFIALAVWVAAATQDADLTIAIIMIGNALAIGWVISKQ